MISLRSSSPRSRQLVPALLLLFAVLFAAVAPAAAQQQDPDELIERVNTSLVLLNVGVADQRGRPVINLSRDDFSVYEDGVKQPIVSFEPAQAPFSLVLLLDMSGSTLNFRPILRQSALRFLDALGPDDRVSVVAFSNGKVTTLSDFSTDRRKAAFAIAELAMGQGQTNLYPALRYSLARLAKEGKRRKAVVVLTDGVDTELRALDSRASADATTSEEAVAAVKPDESAPLRAVLDAADRQGVTVYPLALPSGDPKKLLPFTPQQSAIYAAARARIQTLADRTGGRLHQINRLEDMGRIYAEVAAEMRTLYSIAYQSASTRPRDGGWREITVEVARPELLARTRPGYYAR
ncbi:MAG TPA: VWA domain-containing protein [Pyrinomonadaceae bacterium]|nr:VWA domain-containing protein [Pyrinomonadaceae bacterium]